MGIIINEIKKIFNFKMTSILILGSILFYQMFISFDINVFPNGRPALDLYNITVQMVKDYGNEMDQIEFQHFKNIYEEKLATADKFFSNNTDFNEVGVYSYNDYETLDNKYYNDDKNNRFNDITWDYLINKDEGTLLWELQTYPNLIEFYERRDNTITSNFRGNHQQKRINEIIKNNENESILPNLVFDNYNKIICNFSICIILGISFMLTPLFLQDKKDKIMHLQYSNKYGRNLFKTKLIAGIITALIITTLELIICLILYSSNNTNMFFKSNINSVFNTCFRFSLTFFQYIILTIVATYIINIIVSFISMFISSNCNNYITSIGIQIPVLFITCLLTAKLLVNNLFVLYIPLYLLIFTYVILISVTIILIIKRIRKEQYLDIML